MALASFLGLGCLASRAASPASPPDSPSDPNAGFVPLFPSDGVPAGWMTRSWNDVSLPAPPGSNWTVSAGTLLGGAPRGTWLVSAREFADFVLDFDFRLGERGQGGVAFRFPMAGDPSFEGFEVQLVDPRFYGTNYVGQPWEYTGALFKAVPPSMDAYKPLEWNRCILECLGTRIAVTLNGKKVVDIDVTQHPEPPSRGKPLAERPRRGRLGFQEVSRGLGRVEIRNARVKTLGGRN